MEIEIEMIMIMKTQAIEFRSLAHPTLGFIGFLEVPPKSPMRKIDIYRSLLYIYYPNTIVTIDIVILILIALFKYFPQVKLPLKSATKSSGF